MQPASVHEGVEDDEDEDDADYVPPEHDDGMNTPGSRRLCRLTVPLLALAYVLGDLST